MIGWESALPERVKMTTLTQEIIRIRKNTSKALRETLKTEQMSRFAMKLMISGYDKKKRKEILKAGLKGFQRLEELERSGKRSLNRSRKENYEARLLSKHGAKSTWYKKRGDNKNGGEKKRGKTDKRKREMSDVEKEVEAVMFVPATPDGELAKTIQEADDKLREGSGERRVKVVERGGVSEREIM